MIKKLFILSFVISFVYAIYKIPSYSTPISDFIFNAIEWFVAIFIASLLLIYILGTQMAKIVMGKININFIKTISLLIFNWLLATLMAVSITAFLINNVNYLPKIPGADDVGMFVLYIIVFAFVSYATLILIEKFLIQILKRK